ncbi:MAG: Rpn family recombination-promoting nuclease/putative transposase [Azoarcus sp.]|jgi:predicted transposase/invertase (TIGR01784 family)|nr:Rpn family recombination-promoting nuclease/putative transposase [Azoarcus sp.]
MTRLRYPPRLDVLFKLIFGDRRNPDNLRGLLEATLDLPPEDYDEITLVDPHLAPGYPGDKLCILDIKLKTATGKLIDIEIQLCGQSHIRERILFYQARMISEQIGPGEDYRHIKRTICILIADFALIPENSAYHNRFTLRDPQTGAQFTDLLEIHVLELPKLPADGDGTPLWDWLKFIAARDKEELDMLAEKNPKVRKAVVKYMELTEDERTRMIAQSQRIREIDIEVMKQDAVEQGRTEGRDEATLSIARSLLAEAMPIEKIMRITGL